MKLKIAGQEIELWIIRGALVLTVGVCTLGFFDAYTVHLLILTLIFSILAFGQDVVFGLAGQLLLCEAAFFGIAGYGSALIELRLHLPVLSACLLAALATTACGFLIGMIASRTSGHYLALVTLSVNVIFHEIALNWVSLTNGALGLGNIPRLSVLRVGSLEVNPENDRIYLAICAAVVLGLVEALYRLRRSRLGMLLMAVREDELAAGALGINSAQVKTVAVTLAAVFASVAGPLYAHYQRLISPEDFTVFQSVSILLMVILGGSGSIGGPLLGALVVILLPEYLRAVENFRWVGFGAALVLCTVFFPSGIQGAVMSMGRAVAWSKKP